MADIDLTSLPPDQQHQIHRAGEHLAEEFAGTFGRETIERLLTDSVARLLPTATVTAYLPLLTERFLRERPKALAKIEQLTTDRRPIVLFLCTHNAGRSQMAAGWLRHLAGDRIAVYSGGSGPGNEINPVRHPSHDRNRHRYHRRIPQTMDRQNKPRETLLASQRSIVAW